MSLPVINLNKIRLPVSLGDFDYLGHVSNAFKAGDSLISKAPVNIRRFFPKRLLAERIANHYRANRTYFPEATALILPNELGLTKHESIHLQRDITTLIQHPQRYQQLRNQQRPYAAEHFFNTDTLHSAPQNWHDDGIWSNMSVQPDINHHSSFLYLPSRGIVNNRLDLVPYTREPFTLFPGRYHSEHLVEKAASIPIDSSHSNILVFNQAKYKHRPSDGTLYLQHPYTGEVFTQQELKAVQEKQPQLTFNQRISEVEDPNMYNRFFDATRPLSRDFFALPRRQA